MSYSTLIQVADTPFNLINASCLRTEGLAATLQVLHQWVEDACHWTHIHDLCPSYTRATIVFTETTKPLGFSRFYRPDADTWIKDTSWRSANRMLVTIRDPRTLSRLDPMEQLALHQELTMSFKTALVQRLLFFYAASFSKGNAVREARLELPPIDYQTPSAAAKKDVAAWRRTAAHVNQTVKRAQGLAQASKILRRTGSASLADDLQRNQEAAWFAHRQYCRQLTTGEEIE